MMSDAIPLNMRTTAPAVSASISIANKPLSVVIDFPSLVVALRQITTSVQKRHPISRAASKKTTTKGSSSLD
jgi:hypothetical protein